MAKRKKPGNDRRPPGRAKKSVEAALYGLAKSGRTDNPDVWRVIVARKINGVMGGALVGPWDVDRLDDITIDTIISFSDDLPAFRESIEDTERGFAEWRAKHPTYRK